MYVDRIQEAIRELEVVREKQDVSLCTTMALIYAHKKCSAPGKHIFQPMQPRRKVAQLAEHRCSTGTGSVAHHVSAEHDA